MTSPAIVMTGTRQWHFGTSLTRRFSDKLWEERYGRRGYHFVFKDVLFHAIDTEHLADDQYEDFLTRREIAVGIRDTDLERGNEIYYEPREGRFGMISPICD